MCEKVDVSDIKRPKEALSPVWSANCIAHYAAKTQVEIWGLKQEQTGGTTASLEQGNRTCRWDNVIKNMTPSGQWFWNVCLSGLSVHARSNDDFLKVIGMPVQLEMDPRSKDEMTQGPTGAVPEYRCGQRHGYFGWGDQRIQPGWPDKGGKTAESFENTDQFWSTGSTSEDFLKPYYERQYKKTYGQYFRVDVLLYKSGTPSCGHALYMNPPMDSLSIVTDEPAPQAARREIRRNSEDWRHR